ncbi:hypothetical protein GTY73_07760 [Streptomyces sp. SID8354]|nr:hypothetical protein [Streptomyces sp. SID8354]
MPRSVGPAARNDRPKGAACGFGWSSGYCCKSPDKPFGISCELPCARRDFGCRDDNKADTFSADKPRVGSAPALRI